MIYLNTRNVLFSKLRLLHKETQCCHRRRHDVISSRQSVIQRAVIPYIYYIQSSEIQENIDEI